MSVPLPIYLDNHSTTPVDPRVLEAMLPYFNREYGNAASRHHQFGWLAEAAVERARRQTAALIGATAEEIYFTSGATESINLALKGIAEAYAGKGRHVVTVATEHKAVLDTCKSLERLGYDVTYLPVDRHGLVSLGDLMKSITNKTILVSVMAANNEIGTIPPIAEIGAVCKERGIIFHSDAAQLVAKVPVDVSKIHIDLVSFSAHKMYGPKGIGVLYVRKTSPPIHLTAQIVGGGHERGLRSGTLNVPAIVGLGAAAEIAGTEAPSENTRIKRLRDQLVHSLLDQLEEVWVNGHPTERLPHNASITFAGLHADRLIMDMKEIAVSTGSACSSASPEPSHVLKAIGLRGSEVLATIRFGLGRFTTEEEIAFAVERIVTAVRLARAKSLRYEMTPA